MKLAVAYKDGKVFQHFGHSPAFKIYDIEDGKTVSSEVVPCGQNGHGALAGLLAQLNVEALICGGIGGGAQKALREAGIRLYGGVEGEADSAAESFARGTLEFSPAPVCSHGGSHGHGHTCGEHDCASHACGGHDRS